MSYTKHINRKRKEMVEEPLSISGASQHFNISGEKIDDSEPSRKAPMFKKLKVFK